MCLNDNSASLSARYVSAQLAAMFTNAAECVQHDEDSSHVDMRSHDYDKHKFTRGLAQWHYAGRRVPSGKISKDTLYFDGIFGEPKLEFICNHEVALYLTLRDGHYNSVYPSKSNVSGYKPNSKENVRFDGLEVVFRLGFSRRTVEFTDNKVGNGIGHLVQMIVLDFPTAKLVRLGDNGSFPVFEDPIKFYMRKYLEFLQLAGHHVIFDLPDFDSDTYRHSINYSLVSTAFDKPKLCTDVDLYGVSVSAVNQYLTTAWLDVVARRFSLRRPSDPLANCIYEVRSDWLPTSDHHFHISFAPPVVRPLCKTEVVLYLTASSISFYGTPDIEAKPVIELGGLTFAFVLDVIQDKTNEVTLLKLNMGTARFCHQHSTINLKPDIRDKYFEVLLKFLSEEYLSYLVSYNFHVIFSPHAIFDEGPEFSGISDDEADYKVVNGDSGMQQNETIMWGETVRKITLHGVDHVVAISEESINTLFRSLHLWFPTDCLVSWNYEHFHAEFSPVKIKLLSSGSALVIFTIETGKMTLMKSGDVHDFEAWNIAYEVPIKMVETRELPWNAVALKRFGESPVFGQQTTRHIILDFANAEYIGKQSLMPGMWGTPRSDTLEDSSDALSLFRDGINPLEIVERSRNAVARLETILFYMNSFLKDIAKSGHNVIHSAPIVSPPILTRGDLSLTDVTYQIISKEVTTIANCAYKRTAPVLIVLGMTRGRKFPDNLNITWGNGWVFPRTHGTLCLSKETYLEGRLLPRLSVINARTTVVPRFPEEHEEEWKVYLTTWDQHRYRKREECTWKPLSSSADWLEYGWEHRDEWTYEHEGTRSLASGFSVLCHTKNQLVLPTTYRAGVMDVKLNGESVLRVKDVQQERSKKTVARWSAVLRAVTGPAGLRIALVQKVAPVFERTESTGAWTIDTESMLRNHLPNVIDIDAIIAELKQSLEGYWHWAAAGLAMYDLASPVFTKNGDLIVQLRQNAHIFSNSNSVVIPVASTIPIGVAAVPNGIAAIKDSIPTPTNNILAPVMERSITASSGADSPLLTPNDDENKNFATKDLDTPLVPTDTIVSKAPALIDPPKIIAGLSDDEDSELGVTDPFSTP